MLQIHLRWITLPFDNCKDQSRQWRQAAFSPAGDEFGVVASIIDPNRLVKIWETCKNDVPQTLLLQPEDKNILISSVQVSILS